ncbi:MAG: SLC13 family permease [Candidatus Hodarchaeota archaeon]
MSHPALQIIVAICFIILIIALFFEKADYLTYSFALIVIASAATMFFETPEPLNLKFFVDAIEWDIVFFLISMFTIVEILNDKQIFQEIARRVVQKYSNNIRMMFYVICVVSTISAAFIEDLSVALIFGPIIIVACRRLKINPSPFLLGMTITINLASTLTPFGSAENILIASAYNLNITWFVLTLGIYFAISTAITLVLLDKTVLKHDLEKSWDGHCELESAVKENVFEGITVDKKSFRNNIIALGIFIFLMIIIPQVYIAGIIGLLVFVFINKVTDTEGKKHPSLSYYFRKVDYKLIFFFMCLFILVGLMELNGTIGLIESLIDTIPTANVFLLSVIILLVTSALSGLMDNAPVTVIFLPIISHILDITPEVKIPLLIAFIIGINIGGNFLPQGSACDMATLEIARNNCAAELPFKRLFKVGGLFALLHIVLGVGYLALQIFVLI